MGKWGKLKEIRNPAKKFFRGPRPCPRICEVIILTLTVITTDSGEMTMLTGMMHDVYDDHHHGGSNHGISCPNGRANYPDNPSQGI